MNPKLAAFFTKAAAFHKRQAELHGALHTAHKSHGAIVKAHADGLDDGDQNKAYFTSKAAFHESRATHHLDLQKSHEEHVKDNEEAATAMTTEAAKAAGTPATPAPAAKTEGGAPAPAAPANEPQGLEKLISSTTDKLVEKALSALESDPKITERIQEIVLQKVNAALGQKIVPDGVSVTTPSAPQVVPRPGESELSKASANVAPELLDMVSVPED